MLYKQLILINRSKGGYVRTPPKTKFTVCFGGQCWLEVSTASDILIGLYVHKIVSCGLARPSLQQSIALS